MSIVNGPTNKEIKPMTPKQAAMLAGLLWERNNGRADSLVDAICILQEWELFPWLYINGAEYKENLDQLIGFIEEWLVKLKEYAASANVIIDNKRTKKSKRTGEENDESDN